MTFDRPLFAGYFFQWSNRYGDNPEAPSNVTVVVEPGVLGRVPGPVIVDYTLLEEAADSWDRVVAIYVACETGPYRLPALVPNTRGKLWTMGLPRRPILVYQADRLLNCYQDWWGVQLYYERFCDVVEAAEATMLDLARVPVMLICQAYDRRKGAEPYPRVWQGSDAELAALQPQYLEVARRWPNVLGLLWFSDGRAGGTREYPLVREWHRRILAAIPAEDSGWTPGSNRNPCARLYRLANGAAQLSAFPSAKDSRNGIVMTAAGPPIGTPDSDKR